MTHLNFLKKGYVFNESKQQLEEFVAKKIKFDLDKLTIVYECENRIIDAAQTKVYADVDEFEGAHNEDKWQSLSPKDACWSVFGVYGTLGWVIKNGKPKRISMIEEECLVFDAEADEWVKSELYGKCYCTEREAIDMNEIVVVDVNGNKTIHKGIGRRIQLTEEQLKIEQELMDIITRANENDMAFFLDEDDYHLCIVNDKELHPYDYVYDEHDIEGHRKISDYIHRTDMHIICFGREGLFALPKED